jgi:uncharacterized protein
MSFVPVDSRADSTLAGLSPALQQRYECLRSLLAELGSALVTFSGGVDSTLLLRVAHQVLGRRCAALLALSPSLPDRECREALALAEAMGARLITVETDELSREAYARNEPDRCYHCKGVLLERAAAVAGREGFAHVLMGTNADDLGDHRPGHRAAREQGARHPLLEVGLTKADVRALSRHLALPTWDKPEMACLASRIPYGTRITAGRLGQVERLEAFLKEWGFAQVRVRHHGELARIEVLPEQIAALAAADVRGAVAAAAREAGFGRASVDLEGYRRGSMNEGQVLQKDLQEDLQE